MIEVRISWISSDFVSVYLQHAKHGRKGDDLERKQREKKRKHCKKAAVANVSVSEGAFRSETRRREGRSSASAIKKRCSDLSFRPSFVINMDSAARGMRISGAFPSCVVYDLERANAQHRGADRCSRLSRLGACTFDHVASKSSRDFYNYDHFVLFLELDLNTYDCLSIDRSFDAS